MLVVRLRLLLHDRLLVLLLLVVLLRRWLLVDRLLRLVMLLLLLMLLWRWGRLLLYVVVHPFLRQKGAKFEGLPQGWGGGKANLT